MTTYENFKDSRNIYYLLFLGASFLNFQYFVMAYLAGLKGFGIFCIVSSVFYIILSILTKFVKKLDICLILCFFHVIVFSVTGTLVFGYSSGFSLYLISLIPPCSYLLSNFNVKASRTKMIFFILITLNLISIVLSASDIVMYTEIKSIYHKSIFIANSIYGTIILVGFLNVYLKKLYAHEELLVKQNDKLKKDANFDPLTKLLNRRTFENYFNKHVKKFEEDKTKFSLIIIDIDDFKKVNDTYGHDAGDEVLKNISDLLRDNFRNSEEIFRWGGEELVVLIPQNENISAKVADRFRNVISNNVIVFNDIDIKVTVTIGVSGFKKNDSINDLFERADAALYEGKNSGKNKVVIYKKTN